MITDEIREWVAGVKEGHLNPLDIFIQLKDIEQILKLAIDELREEAIDEATKYEGKTFTHLNAKITLKNDAGRWDYSHISMWKEENQRLKEVEYN